MAEPTSTTPVPHGRFRRHISMRHPAFIHSHASGGGGSARTSRFVWASLLACLLAAACEGSAGTGTETGSAGTNGGGTTGTAGTLGNGGTTGTAGTIGAGGTSASGTAGTTGTAGTI